jgi:hypothetical protein
MIILPTNSCEDTDCPYETNLGWRYVLILTSLIILIIVIFRSCVFDLHESPKYLLSKGKFEEASKILKQLSEINGKNIEIDFECLRPLIIRIEAEGGINLISDLLKSLFVPDLLITTVMLWIIWITTSIAYYTFNSFLPVFLNSGEIERSVWDIYVDCLFFGIFGVPGSILGFHFLIIVCIFQILL